jgi:hypothetical protein
VLACVVVLELGCLEEGREHVAQEFPVLLGDIVEVDRIGLGLVGALRIHVLVGIVGEDMDLRDDGRRVLGLVGDRALPCVPVFVAAERVLDRARDVGRDGSREGLEEVRVLGIAEGLEQILEGLVAEYEAEGIVEQGEGLGNLIVAADYAPHPRLGQERGRGRRNSLAERALDRLIDWLELLDLVLAFP